MAKKGSNEPSIFSKIITREIPANIVYEDDDFIAFHDIHPKAPVHVLIVSKYPYSSLEEIDFADEKLHARLLQTARKLAKQLGIQKNYKLAMNVGPQMQQIMHLHLHLLGGWPEKEVLPLSEL